MSFVKFREIVIKICSKNSKFKKESHCAREASMKSEIRVVVVVVVVARFARKNIKKVEKTKFAKLLSLERCKNAHLVDLEKCRRTSIHLQRSPLIQPRTGRK